MFHASVIISAKDLRETCTRRERCTLEALNAFLCNKIDSLTKRRSVAFHTEFIFSFTDEQLVCYLSFEIITMADDGDEPTQNGGTGVASDTVPLTMFDGMKANLIPNLTEPNPDPRLYITKAKARKYTEKGLCKYFVNLILTEVYCLFYNVWFFVFKSSFYAGFSDCRIFHVRILCLS